MPTYGKIIIFVLFVLVGFALVPFMIGLFIDLQIKIGNGESEVITFLDENRMAFTIGVWIIFALGLGMAIPAMIKDGFFEPEASEGLENTGSPITAVPANTAGTVESFRKKSAPPKAPPSGARPPLEYQINAAKIILLATTRMTEQGDIYNVNEIWKKETPDDSFNTNSVMLFDTSMWEMIGYKPKDGQQVVIFLLDEDLPGKVAREIIPVENGVITYGAGDPAVQKTLTLDEFKRKLTDG